MQSSQTPTKFPIPFGNNAAAGTIRSVPQASQTAVTPGAASLYDGFPTITGQPLASGGIPPSMQDFNGILNQITAWNRWQAAGGTVQFDSVFAAAIGGYPRGAIVSSATTPGKLWLSTVDGNTTDPDSPSTAGWVSSGDIQAAIQNGWGFASYINPGTFPFTVPAGVTKVRVRVWAGGGGSNASGSGSIFTAGASGGGYTEKLIGGLTPGQVITVVVGTGGAAAAAGSAGGNGGSSSFGAYCSATGGTGSSATPTSGVAAGFGTGGDDNRQGEGGGGAISGVKAGDGGGGGGGGGTRAPGGNGGTNPGNFPGGGAAGAPPNTAGAAGASGAVYIMWGGAS